MCLDERAGQYRALRGANDVAEYLAKPSERSDEELLTEPILRAIIERVLGFPRDAYFEQLGKGGHKPDFTPFDLLAHSFVFDSKASDQALAAHETQIRRYMDQRRLDYGVLFNLREFRTYRRNVPGHDPDLSFQVLPLWQVARGFAIPAEEVERFEAFCEHFAYRTLGIDEKIEYVALQESWASRLAHGDPAEVDVEFLVEQLRHLSRVLADDASAQAERFDEFLALNPGRERRVVHELQLLALDIAPGTDIASLPDSAKSWRADQGLTQRVWQQYLLRVAYLALTRILLYRAWEDVQLVDEYLYDGGFGQWYDRLDSDVQRVLEEAFLHGQQQYHWLFGHGNNYDWYRPRDSALVDVLYSLAPVPLGRLDADVLGALYETYVDEIDRDRRGQFFTPRAVVKFMLDRVGFTGPEGVFRIEGDKRIPRQIFDFATGSGGFLVEAARRIVDEGGIDETSPRDLREAPEAIVRGFVGGEISPFPYYLTEVNVLLQVSRLLGYLRTAGEAAPPFAALGVLNIDTLQAKSGTDTSLDVAAELRKDHAELSGGIQLDFLPPLDEEKLETYRSRLRPDEAFDVVVGNPPYVTEANNKPLFDLLRQIAAWRGIYRGKTDYSYYFLWLAVEKLKPGGRLCVITPAGWMNAGAADFLREKLASELRLDELFLFGSYRLFATETNAPTPTVESAILVATRTNARKDHKIKVVALEDETQAPVGRQALLDEMARRVTGPAGRRAGLHVHRLSQAELRSEYPWPVKFGEADVPGKVVAHLQSLFDRGLAQPLSETWKAIRGIETAADAYTRRIQRRLTAEQRNQLAQNDLKIGDPIMELPAGVELRSPW